MGWTGDPHRDFDRHDREQARALSRYPKCSCCGEHIQGDFVYVFEAERLCEDCLNENYRKYVDDYIS